ESNGSTEAPNVIDVCNATMGGTWPEPLITVLSFKCFLLSASLSAKIVIFSSGNAHPGIRRLRSLLDLLMSSTLSWKKGL
ncbi:hypothetical protein BaRGS_00015302, partial [Batillaria attramentaria]